MYHQQTWTAHCFLWNLAFLGLYWEHLNGSQDIFMSRDCILRLETSPVNVFYKLSTRLSILRLEYDTQYRKVWETDQNKDSEVSAFAYLWRCFILDLGSGFLSHSPVLIWGWLFFKIHIRDIPKWCQSALLHLSEFLRKAKKWCTRQSTMCCTWLLSKYTEDWLFMPCLSSMCLSLLHKQILYCAGDAARPG